MILFFFENLIKSSSASEYDVQFIWQAENNAQKNQNSFRVFINYFIKLINLWFWHDFFKKKIAILQDLFFLKILKNFEIYLNLTDWFWQYISYYV